MKLIARRKILLGAMTALLPAISRAHTDLRDLDGLDTPKNMLDTYARIVGSTEDQTVYIEYFGDIFAVIPGEVQERILKVKGIARSAWKKTTATSYASRNFDQGIFCDATTGLAIERFENPFTGLTNFPLHYKSGPIDKVYSAGAIGTPAFTPEWHIIGKQIEVRETGAGAVMNYLAPEQWPLASTGEQLQFSVSESHVAELDDVLDPKLAAVGATHFWTFLAPFAPWMLMGERPGYLLWRWVGRKLLHKSELNAELAQEVAQHTPGFFRAEDPWTERLNGWLQYRAERAPVKPTLK